MNYIIPASPNYLSFLDIADSIDDLGEWLGGATVTGVYEFRLMDNEEPLVLTSTDTTQFIAPNLAAAENNNFKFLRTNDNKFLCQREE